MTRKTPIKRKAPMRRQSKPLPPVSKKRKAANVEYEKAKRIWRAGHDGRCEVLFHAANGPAQTVPIERGAALSLQVFRCRNAAAPDPHHMALRGPNLCKIETFLGVCRDCHNWIHANANEARRLGYLIR